MEFLISDEFAVFKGIFDWLCWLFNVQLQIFRAFLCREYVQQYIIERRNDKKRNEIKTETAEGWDYWDKNF